MTWMARCRFHAERTVRDLEQIRRQQVAEHECQRGAGYSPAQRCTVKWLDAPEVRSMLADALGLADQCVASRLSRRRDEHRVQMPFTRLGQRGQCVVAFEQRVPLHLVQRGDVLQESSRPRKRREERGGPWIAVGERPWGEAMKALRDCVARRRSGERSCVRSSGGRHTGESRHCPQRLHPRRVPVLSRQRCGCVTGAVRLSRCPCPAVRHSR